MATSDPGSGGSDSDTPSTLTSGVGPTGPGGEDTSQTGPLPTTMTTMSGDTEEPTDPSDTGNAADCTWNAGNLEGEVEIADVIDDFEDGDGSLRSSDGRSGSWGTYSDGTGSLTPGVGEPLTPEAVTGTSSRAPGSELALRVMGDGFSDWGGGVGTSLADSGSPTPYAASAYEGIAFWAKGSGAVRVQVPIAAIAPPEEGGNCQGDCSNAHGVTIELNADWTPYEIPFSSLQQQDGWGHQADFDPGSILSVQFAVGSGATLDLWVDDIGFYSPGAMPPVESGCRDPGGGDDPTEGDTDGDDSGGDPPDGRPGGAVPTPGPAGTCSTTTTRYWDCCKPHCAWSGNVGHSAPVSTCSPSDAPTGPDTGSVCDGGGNGAMTCTSNAPWAVSDTVAFGFAVAPQSAGDACGRCYQLNFDGPLSGKVMYVQATNIGTDVVDHFDLLIPGGGVGIFTDGCSQAFPGLAEAGAQYGGFAATCGGDHGCIRDKCNQIFGSSPYMLEGCLWYLDWFGAADNPRVQYKEVECPSQLVEVSGMQGPGNINTSCG